MKPEAASTSLLSATSVGFALLGLCALAFTLPLQSTLAEEATFFVAQRAPAEQIVLFVLGIYLLLPVALLGVFIAIRALLGSRVANVYVCVAIGILSGLWALPFVKSLSGQVGVPVCVLVSLLAGLGYSRSEKLRSALRMVGQISLLVPVFFLFFTPVKTLLFPSAELTGLASAGENNPVVMLVFDELPLAAILKNDQEINAQRFPNFARLQELSTWYREATTISSSTGRAMVGILSGMRAEQGALPIHALYPQNIFTVVSNSHRVLATESISQMCPPSVCEATGPLGRFSAQQMYSDAWYVWLHSVLPLDLAERYLPSIAGRWQGFNQSDDSRAEQSAKEESGVTISGRFATFMRNMNEEGPVLNYLHVGFPHRPWRYLPDGTQYNGLETPSATFDHAWKDSEPLVDQALLRFNLQMEFVDVLLGQTLDALQASGRLEDTLLIVVADHGLVIERGKNSRRPSADTLADVARIPLFIKYPAQTLGKVDTQRIETIDLLPTVTDVLNVALTLPVDGRSLLNQEREASPRKVIEAGPEIRDIEEHMDLSVAINRFNRNIELGTLALQNWAAGSGGKYFGFTPPKATPQTREFSLHLDRPEWYRNVILDSGFLPVRLTGKVPNAIRGEEFLIAINGTIAGGNAISDAYRSLSVMLDPAQFREGSNELTAYLLREDKLEEIEVISPTEPEWTVEYGASGITKVTDNRGQEYFAASEKKGSALIDGGMVVSGTSKDLNSQTSADHLLLVDGSRVITDKFRSFKGRAANNAIGRAWFSRFSVQILPEQRRPGAKLAVLALWESDGSFLAIPVIDEAIDNPAINP